MSVGVGPRAVTAYGTHPAATLRAMGRSDVTLLDGGMGKELRRIGAPFRQPEWSALALMHAPERVTEAHDNFVDAGASIITTSNYAVVPFHLGDDRFADHGHELTSLAGRLARDVADRRDVLVAGSLPPPFGSYRPDLFSTDRAPTVLGTIVSALAPYVDLWLPETLSSLAEVRASIDALDRSGTAAQRWISVTLDDHRAGFAEPLRLPSGEALVDAAALIASTPDVAAMLVNCSMPESITPAIASLRAALPEDIRVGGYANAFPPDPPPGYAANETVHEPRPDLTPERYADIVEQWVDGGATIVGGCCDITPAHIGALRARRDRHDRGR